MNHARLIRWAIVLAAFGAVEALCRTGVVKPFTMIAPTEMIASIFRIAATQSWFAEDCLYSLRNLAVAVVLAVLGGFAVGLLVHAFPRLRACLDPIFSSYYSVPTFILYPIFIVLFGIGPMSLIAMGSVFGVVAMISATLTALDRIPRVLTKVARIEKLDPLRTIALVRLPAAAPHLFTGLKLAVAYCIIGVVAGEFILATQGIGRRLSLSYNNFDNQTMYGVLLLILTFAATINGLLNAWERRIHRRWFR